MLGNDLTVIDGAEAGAWIEAGLGGEFGAVSLQVPKIFDAYARVFHRATDGDGNHVTWGEVAKRLGRTAHREMQWHQLVGSSDSDNFTGSKWSGGRPELGEMEVEELDRLCRVLAAHTADPERCLFGLCTIQNWKLDALPAEAERYPQLGLPWGRDHVVLSGPLSAVDQIGYADQSNVIWGEVPNLIWPSDRSWLVVSEVDFDSTLVGGSSELVEALIADSDLEVYAVEPDTSLAAFSDEINWVPEPED